MSEYFKTNIKSKTRERKKCEFCGLIEHDFDKDNYQVDHYFNLTGDYLGAACQNVSILLIIAINISLYRC